MTGKEMLEKLQTFSEESLNQEIYILGADCMVKPVEFISISEDGFTDEDEMEIPAGSIVIDW